MAFRNPPLPPLAKGIPLVGDTFDYLKLGPYYGVPHHAKHGDIYRYANVQELGVTLRDCLPHSCSCCRPCLQTSCCDLVCRSYLLGEQVVHVGDGDNCRKLMTSEHKLVEGIY